MADKLMENEIFAYQNRNRKIVKIKAAHANVQKPRSAWISIGVKKKNHHERVPKTQIMSMYRNNGQMQ